MKQTFHSMWGVDDAGSSVGYVGGVGGNGLSNLGGRGEGMAALPSGPTTTSRPNSSRASFNKNEPGHLTPRDFARSSSLGGHTRAATSTSGPASTNPNGSLGQESGFQSC